MLNTTEDAGTRPETTGTVSRSLGLSAGMRTDRSLKELEASLSAGIPVIAGMQAWRDNTSPPFWADDWDDGHYLVVIGLGNENAYLEDLPILGARSMIPRNEFLARWHDLDEKDIRDPGVTTYRRPGIFIRGEKPAQYPAITYVD